MKLYSINHGLFKVDGGGMFGVVPKSIWQHLNRADEYNLSNWAQRSLLVENENRLILVDTGIGDKLSESQLHRFPLLKQTTIEDSLKKIGFNPEDITDVFLTHLHFDHCGGCFRFNEAKNGFRPVFPNAIYWTNELHWKWALNPNVREQFAFLADNIIPLKDSGKLNFLSEGEDLISGFSTLFVYGHTKAMMVPVIDYQGIKVIYAADLVPSKWHIKLAYNMAFDLCPITTIQEKEKLLKEVVKERSVLFMEHDPETECCTVKKNGADFYLDQEFSLTELTNSNRST